MQIKEIKKMSDKYDFPVEETRYVIADDDGKIVDDAQGYGYKTKQNAMKAMWWKFKNGKCKHDELARWWKKSPNDVLLRRIFEMEEINLKELARGEFTLDDVFNYAADEAGKLGIPDFDKEKFKFIHSKNFRLLK